jgi:hypothetical protein
MTRKFTDIFFKYLIRIVALFSVLALGAILLFVFTQGSMPFFTSTYSGIRLVVQRIDEITVNGVLYKNHNTFINIPKKLKLIITKKIRKRFFLLYMIVILLLRIPKATFLQLVIRLRLPLCKKEYMLFFPNRLTIFLVL